MLENPSFVHVVVTIHSLRGGVTTLSHLQKKKEKKTLKRSIRNLSSHHEEGLKLFTLGCLKQHRDANLLVYCFLSFYWNTDCKQLGHFGQQKRELHKTTKPYYFLLYISDAVGYYLLILAVMCLADCFMW